MMPQTDFTDQYNTALDDKAELRFQAWLAVNPKRARDLAEYDLRGWWQAHRGRLEDKRAHLSDEFKKPNHPTFSTDSRYSKGDEIGGAWHRIGRKPDGSEKWVFRASPVNRRMHGDKGLRDYFARVEPGEVLAIPRAIKAELPPLPVETPPLPPVKPLLPPTVKTFGKAQPLVDAFTMLRDEKRASEPKPSSAPSLRDLFALALIVVLSLSACAPAQQPMVTTVPVNTAENLMSDWPKGRAWACFGWPQVQPVGSSQQRWMRFERDGCVAGFRFRKSSTRVAVAPEREAVCWQVVQNCMGSK